MSIHLLRERVLSWRMNMYRYLCLFQSERAHKTTEYEHISLQCFLIKQSPSRWTFRPHSSAFYPDPPTEALSHFSSWEGPHGEVCHGASIHGRPSVLALLKVMLILSSCGKQRLSEWANLVPKMYQEVGTSWWLDNFVLLEKVHKLCEKFCGLRRKSKGRLVQSGPLISLVFKYLAPRWMKRGPASGIDMAAALHTNALGWSDEKDCGRVKKRPL